MGLTFSSEHQPVSPFFQSHFEASSSLALRAWSFQRYIPLGPLQGFRLSSPQLPGQVITS